jgi:hypothetical protein
MTMLVHGDLTCVDTKELPWRPSTFAPGVFVKDIATTDGWEMQLVRFEPRTSVRSSSSSSTGNSSRPADA